MAMPRTTSDSCCLEGNCSEHAQVAAKELGFDPVKKDEHTVAQRHLLGDVDASPQQVGKAAIDVEAAAALANLRQRPDAHERGVHLVCQRVKATGGRQSLGRALGLQGSGVASALVPSPREEPRRWKLGIGKGRGVDMRGTGRGVDMRDKGRGGQRRPCRCRWGASPRWGARLGELTSCKDGLGETSRWGGLRGSWLIAVAG
eukprot:184264-Chlamydomonas_euryale.AAC.3